MGGTLSEMYANKICKIMDKALDTGAMVGGAVKVHLVVIWLLCCVAGIGVTQIFE